MQIRLSLMGHQGKDETELILTIKMLLLTYTI